MFLDSKNISEIQRLLDSGKADAIEKMRGSDISLTVALFLALAHRSALNAQNVELARIIDQLELPGVRRGIECLAQKGSQLSAEPFGSPAFDVYRIGSKQDLLSDEWCLFYDRFRRSAANGRIGNMYRAVGGVLGEMGDNVVWHAFEADDKPCPALAGFHVADGTASFCVADCGQGFLRSLRRNPIWSQLSNDDEALDAVVNKHATSRGGEIEGGGFKQLFNSLLDFIGIVVLRSGGCTYALHNSHQTRRLNKRQTMPVTGSAVTVVISPRGQPAEFAMKNTS